MAEILIKNIAPDRPDMTPGDREARIVPLDGVVAVRENGHEWGAGETMAAYISAGGTPETYHWNFLLLRVPGVGAVFLQDMIQPVLEPIMPGDPDYYVDADEADRWRRTHLREWRLDLSKFSPPQRQKLTEDAELTITNWGQARRAIRSVVDGRGF